jgi:hypothetical protein
MGFDPAPFCAAPIPNQKRRLPIRPPSRRLPRPEGRDLPPLRWSTAAHQHSKLNLFAEHAFIAHP